MRTHYYALRSDRLWWARIWVTSDGLITIASDYGHFGYWFGMPGCEFRKFLTQCDPGPRGYMAIKLSDGRRVYDADTTVRRIREEVVRLRRQKEFDREVARELWNSVTEHNLDEHDHDVRAWLDEELVQDHLGYEAWEYFSRMIPSEVQDFMIAVWPVFVEKLKADLLAESKSEAFRERAEMLDMGV